jgi:tetratricopeptide (TPR) repeat protein
VVLVRLDSPILRVIAIVIALGAAAWLARVIVAPAVADQLAQGATTAAELERALSWDPGNPDLHLRAARAEGAGQAAGSLERARRHLEAALAARPTHSDTWLQLAQLADRQGQAARAGEALANALRLDPHNVGLRWEAALLFLRWGEREAALDHLRYVIAVDPSQRDAAFQLARALLGPGVALTSMLPAAAEPLTGILAAAVRSRDLELARATWERRAPLAPGIPVGLQRDYLELLLREGEGVEARRLWQAMVPDGRPGAGGNAVWNGGFEADRLLGWGFDWQVRPVWGVEVGLDRFVAAQGRQSLRLVFNGFPTLDFAGVSQAVAVEPGREYRLRAMAKAVDFTTRSGLKLQVVTPDDEARVLGETPSIAGTTPDWLTLETRLRVPAGVTVVRVRLRREKAPGPEGNLGGKIWVDEVSLSPIGGAGA